MKLLKFRDILVRLGTTDKETVASIIREYRWLNPSPGDVILDIGACFGAFTAWAERLGARVIAIEPMEENYDLLCKNAPEATCIRAAVVKKTPPVEVLLYLSNTKSMGSHTLKPTRGRRSVHVPAVTLSGLLDKYKPNKLKVDCEGAEYELFLDYHLPRFVRGIVLEYHLNKRWTDRPNATQMHGELLSQGFTPMVNPRIGPKNWHTIGAYQR